MLGFAIKIYNRSANNMFLYELFIQNFYIKLYNISRIYILLIFIVKNQQLKKIKTNKKKQTKIQASRKEVTY